jgi:hypothetical protein
MFKNKAIQLNIYKIFAKNYLFWKFSNFLYKKLTFYYDKRRLLHFWNSLLQNHLYLMQNLNYRAHFCPKNSYEVPQEYLFRSNFVIKTHLMAYWCHLFLILGRDGRPIWNFRGIGRSFFENILMGFGFFVIFLILFFLISFFLLYIYICKFIYIYIYIFFY